MVKLKKPDPILQLMQHNIKTNVKYIVIGGLFCLVMLAVAFFALYMIIEVSVRWLRAVLEQRRQKEAAMAAGKNALLDPSNDNFVYSADDDGDDENDDDYKRITQNIQNIYKVYSEYNAKLQAHYQESRKEDGPDRIDQKSIFNPNLDNW